MQPRERCDVCSLQLRSSARFHKPVQVDVCLCVHPQHRYSTGSHTHTGKGKAGGWDVGTTCDFMVGCVCVWGISGCRWSRQCSRAAAMAQVKVAGDAARSHQDCAEVYSDMATVSSRAGESENTLWKKYIIISPLCHPLQQRQQRDMQ